MYKTLKKQNGEKFAQTLRNFHNGLLEIPDLDVILRYAGREAEPLLPYLMSLLASNDDIQASAPDDPFVLLDRAGYNALHADTLEKQNSIQHYFASGELLCTFNDSARYQDYHIVHAVKKDADQIQRRDFVSRERREDEYGTSVISIQILKKGGSISIKNRYNHAVDYCDNTFNSNPDNIIEGLSAALKEHFNVDFSVSGSALPDGFVLMGSQIFKYHTEDNNIYYGHNAWAKNRVIKAVDKVAGDAMFDQFLFDNKNKKMEKIDPTSDNSFAAAFNDCYGKNEGLRVESGNLTLNGEILIGAEKSRIKTLSLPGLITMPDNCLSDASALIHFKAPDLMTMGSRCLHVASSLKDFEAPALKAMGYKCLSVADALTHFEAKALMVMHNECLDHASALTHFEAPALTTMGNRCLERARALTHFEAPALTTMGDSCLSDAWALTHFEAPCLTTMGRHCLTYAGALTHFEAPSLTTMSESCLINASALTHFEAPALTRMGRHCLLYARALTHFAAPSLKTMGNYCLEHASALTLFNAGDAFLPASCHKPSLLKEFHGRSKALFQTLLGSSHLEPTLNTLHKVFICW